MSDTVAGAERDRRGQQPPPRAGRRPSLLTPVNLGIAVATALALALRLYHVLRPGLLNVTQYDDGPYFGSAVLLVHGVLPYRDFVLVQPPGITLLMSPVALLSRVTGTAWGLAIGRLLTAAVGAAAVPAAGLLVRHRGLLTTLVTCGIMAVYPSSVSAAHTVLLEPWLVLFCLAGALAVFDGDGLATSARRLAWGGAAFGFAGAVKAWAIVPVAVLAVMLLPRPRRAAVFAGGVAAGFLIPVLPFAVAAPRQIFDNVVAAQLARVSARVSLAKRLQDMIGVVGLHPAQLGNTLIKAVVITLAVVIALVLVIATMAAARSRGHRAPALDGFAAVTAALVVAMFLWPPYFASHYTAFLTPFLALALALPLSGLAPGTGPRGGADGGGARPGPRGYRHLWWVTVGTAGLMMAWAIFPPPVSLSSRDLAARSAAVMRVIPPGACVISDQVSYLLLTDRFLSSVPDCPRIVDGLGTDLVLSHGLDPATGAGRVPAVAAFWRNAFRRAQYVLLSKNNGLRIAWTPALRAYFRRHFRRAVSGQDFEVYARKGLRVPARTHRHTHHRGHRHRRHQRLVRLA